MQNKIYTDNLCDTHSVIIILGRLVPANIEEFFELRIRNDQGHTPYNTYKDYT
jgi:hypothetical protein